MVIVRDTSPGFEEVVSQVIRSVIAIAVGLTEDKRPHIVGTAFALERAEFFATCWHVAEVDDELHKLNESELHKKGLCG